MDTGIVDIIILFYNKVDQTISCIQSFLPSGQQIYVLNNGSDTAQLKKLKQTFERNESVHILDADNNLGVSGGRNFLIHHTKAPWLFSVDNDITIRQQHNWLDTFKQFLNLNSEVRIVAPLLYNLHEQANSLQLNVYLDDNRMHVETGQFKISNCFPGGASIIHRSIFEKYGYFDEGMFVGFEDYEFALRAMLSDEGAFKVHHIQSIEMVHDHQFQKSSKDRDAVRLRYNEERLTASYERMVKKYGIEFEHNWQWWTKKQVQEMTEKRWITRIKQFISRFMNF